MMLNIRQLQPFIHAARVSNLPESKPLELLSALMWPTVLFGILLSLDLSWHVPRCEELSLWWVRLKLSRLSNWELLQHIAHW